MKKKREHVVTKSICCKLYLDNKVISLNISIIKEGKNSFS